MYRLVVLCVILLAVTGYAYASIEPSANLPTQSQPAGTATPSPAPTPTLVRDVAAFQELVQRLEGFSYPGSSAQQAQIYVGRLPDKMPVDIPLPDGSRVIGSIVRGEMSIQIVLDATLAPDRVFDFYRQRMVALGWTALDQPVYPSGGFVPSLPLGITLCKSSTGPALFVNASAERGQATDVRLNLNIDRTLQSACTQPRPGAPMSESIIPRLVAPQGARQTGGGSGGSSDGSSYNSATIVTDQSASTLAAFYGDQLAKAGWAKQDSGQSGAVAWSTWLVRDKDGKNWRGMFFALDLPGTPPQRFVYVRVDLQ